MTRILRYSLLFLLLVRTPADGLILESRVEGGGLSPGAILNVAAICLALLSLLLRPQTSAKIPFLVWGPYLAISGISLTYATDAFGAVRFFLSMVSYPAIFTASLLLLRSERDVVLLFKCVILSSIIPSAVAFYQVATEGFSDRIQGTLGHPNIFAFYILSVLIAILYYWHAKRPSLLKRYVLGAYSVLQLALLLFTQTRNAWGAAAIVAMIYAIVVNRKLLLALPAIPMLLLVPPIADRITNVEATQNVTFDEVERGLVVVNSYVWRQKLWGAALEHSANDRLMGKGFNSFHDNSAAFFPLGATEAHSGYVQAIYEIGLIGLLTYAWLYVSVGILILHRRENYTKQGWVICCLVAANLVVNYADNIPYYLAYNWYIWSMFGADLALRYSRMRASSSQADQPEGAFLASPSGKASASRC
ncbi:O-antigen ligase family protein [Bradyrhizobium sp. B117]|uniref:O-antigen ligase family protein n=1 Tax=Bradyrhizobium sp. B117 TaxID=3140246 RepID=UPI0031830ABB